MEASSNGLSILDIALQTLAGCMRFFEAFTPPDEYLDDFCVQTWKIALLRLRLLRWSKSAYSDLRDGDKISDVEKIMIITLLTDMRSRSDWL